MRRLVPVFIAVAAVAVVVGAYAALGGASYRPTPVADPCQPRARHHPDGIQEALEQVALSALDRAACQLGVSRESLVLALRDEASLDKWSQQEGVPRKHVEDVLQRSLVGALDEAQSAGSLSSFAAGLVRGVAKTVPPWLLLDVLERLRGLLS